MARAVRHRALLLAMVTSSAVAAALAAFGCLELRAREDGSAEPVNPCVTCHGSTDHGGPVENQAAPPIDLDGQSETWRPGVGAHQIHLRGWATHGPIACRQCHLVPQTIDMMGHADSPRPAEFVPGELARQGGRAAHYDSTQRTCIDTYCHRSARPIWTEPRGSTAACGTCHGLPPIAPHVQNDQCYRCHGEIIDAEQRIIDAVRHVDGVITVVELTCYTCHGSEQSFAPPPDLSGSSEISDIGVGNHQLHLSGGSFSAPVACGDCHLVPSTAADAGHWDETAGAEVTFSGVAVVGGRTPSWDRAALVCTNSWCHGVLSPAWTTDTGGSPPPCHLCHGMPPPLPHVQVDDCTSCHAEVVEGPPGSVTIIAPQLHVDGIIQSNPPTG